MYHRYGEIGDCCYSICEPLQVLVCGYAPNVRRNRWIAMLIAYADDSNRGRTKSAYVLAGFLAKTESWLAFGHAWKAVLDLPPAISYFKSREAAFRIGQFRGWSVDDVGTRINQLVALITDETFGIRRVCISVPIKHYTRIFKGRVDKRFDNPFFLPHYSLIQQTLRYLAIERHETTDKVNFIFDEATNREKRLIRASWEYFETYGARDTRSLYGDEPDFKSDKDVLPLQAADLYARHARLFYDARAKGNTYSHSVWGALNAMEGTDREWTAVDLKNVFDMIPRDHDRLRTTLEYLKHNAR
jgi:Protein of unknown function (DUF3800)